MAVVGVLLACGAVGASARSAQRPAGPATVDGPGSSPASRAARLPSTPSDPFARQIDALQRDVWDRDNELLHLRAELADAHATIDALKLTLDGAALIQRCALLGVRCAWDEHGRRIAVTPEKEPAR